MFLKKNHIRFSLEPTLLDRHRENSRCSDFQGTPFELLLFMVSTFENRLRTVGGCVDKFKWGRFENTFVMKGTPSENFRAMGESRTLHGMEKPPADNVDLVIRVIRSRKGKVSEVELIDFQAWPMQRDVDSESSQSAA